MITITMDAPFPLPSPWDKLPEAGVTEKALRKGEALFRQGEQPWALFLVRRGTVSLVRHTEAGRAVPIFRAMPGDTLAEASLFSDTYHCDCIAQCDANLFAFPKPAILRQMAGDPGFSRALVHRLSVQVQTYRRKLELFAIASAKERVLAALADGWLQGSVMAFAAEIGLTHEATYRALAALVQEGRAQKTGRGRYIAVAE